MPCRHELTFPLPSAIYGRRPYVEADTLRHSTEDVTNVAKVFGGERGRLQLAGPTQALGEAVDKLSVVWREIVEETVDSLDDHAPLRETRDDAERVESSFELVGHADAELRIILDLLSMASARGGTADTPAVGSGVSVRHTPIRRCK